MHDLLIVQVDLLAMFGTIEEVLVACSRVWVQTVKGENQ
jgi:hypothetical protein